MTLIKNCGLRFASDLTIAADTGASFVGFVHHAASPRHLDIPAIAALKMHTPSVLKTVVVMVDPSDSTIDEVTRVVDPDYLQIHKVDASRAAMISERTRLPLILGVAMRDLSDMAVAQSLEPIAEHLLLDAPESGSGMAFDWNVLKAARFRKPWFLAGGLTVDNVAEAIRTTGAPMVDVSSGIEDTPGHKSPEKIAAFNRVVLEANSL